MMSMSRSVGIIAAHHLFTGTAQFSYYCVNRRPQSCGRGGCVRADLDNRQSRMRSSFCLAKQRPGCPWGRAFNRAACGRHGASVRPCAVCVCAIIIADAPRFVNKESNHDRRGAACIATSPPMPAQWAATGKRWWCSPGTAARPACDLPTAGSRLCRGAACGRWGMLRRNRKNGIDITTVWPYNEVARNEWVNGTRFCCSKGQRRQTHRGYYS